MPQGLTEKEHRALLEGIRLIYSARSLDELPDRVLDALAPLIPSNLAGYNEVNTSLRRLVVAFRPGPPSGFAERRHVWEQFMHQHPVLSYYQQSGDGQALAISDFLSAGEYRSTELYRDFYRYIGCGDQIAVGIKAREDVIIGIAFNRTTRTFAGRDRHILNLMRPHIVQAYSNAREFDALRAERETIASVIEENGLGVVTLAADGSVRSSSPSALKALRQDFLCETPADFRALVSRLSASPAPLDSPSGIRVRLARETEPIVLTLTELSAQSPQLARRYALTRRELEILRWIAAGKSNKEIAVILGLSTFTIKKHVENLLQKLGAENRTTAAALYRAS